MHDKERKKAAMQGSCPRERDVVTNGSVVIG